MFNTIRDKLAASNDTYYRLGLWKDNQYHEHHYIRMSACSNLYSVSKMVTATAAGLAYDKGLLDADDRILDYLGDYKPSQASPHLGQVTIRHLLSQTSGISQGGLFESDRYTVEGDDWITRMLSREYPHEPGTAFVYDNGNYYLAACIVELVSGQSLDMFLKENLFHALGIQEYAWERCPRGHVMGATGLYMRIEDINKLGQVYLNRGIYNGQRVLSEKWIAMATTPHPNNSGTAYGFCFTRGEDGDYFCPGAYNQLIYISEKYHAVVSVQGFNSGTGADILVRDGMRGR